MGGVQIPKLPATTPAAMDVTERRVPENLLNPPRTPVPRSRMYEPKLSVGFDYVPRSSNSISSSLQTYISRLNQSEPSLQVTMTVQGETARLEGIVGTQHARFLLEQMVLFEPGISAVQNDLQVLSADQ